MLRRNSRISESDKMGESVDVECFAGGEEFWLESEFVGDDGEVIAETLLQSP
jgi:hypothetical protein